MITQERAESLATERQPAARKGQQPGSGYLFPDSLEIALPGEDTRTQEVLPAAYTAEWNRFLVEQLTLVEQERQRIAADLHDGLGQSLCLLARSLRQLASRAGNAAGCAIDDQLSQITHSVDGMLAELRRTAMNLRPSMLDDLGLLATLSWFLRDVESSCPGLQVQRRIQLVESDVPDGLKTAIFRIVQEAFTNALKHAQAGRLDVTLRKRYDRLQLRVHDDGKGFELPAAMGVREAGCGFGLRSMRARAEGSGGQFQIKSTPGQGTQVQVEWGSIYASVPKA